MLTVKLYGALQFELPKKYRRSGVRMDASRVPEVLYALEQFFPINRALFFEGAEFRVGKTLKTSRLLKLEEATRGQLCGISGTDDVVLHIIPGITGNEITSAMVIASLVASAVSIGVSILMAVLFPPSETSTDKRKSVNYAGGNNTQKENLPLPYVAGEAVLLASNFIETDVEVLQSGLSPTFTPGPGATEPGASGGLAGPGVIGGGFFDILHEVWGSKGGGKTRSDNMFSYAKMKMLGAVGAGPLGGIVGETDEEKEQNIFIEDIPLRDRITGRRIYEGVLWAERYGVEGQTAPTVTPGIATVQDDNTALVRETAGGSPGTIVKAVSEGKVNRAKLRVNMALVETSKKGNQYDTDMSIAVHTRRGPGTWVHFGTWHWRGKSSSAVQSEMFVHAPPGDQAVPWEFMVERITPDSTSDRLQNDTTFNGWTEVMDNDLTYDGSGGEPPTALFGMSIDAAQFNITNPPEVASIWAGRLCRVPTGYNPKTRTYPAFWDGTWTRAVTANPVWHWLEFATDKLVGAGIDESYFNKFALLDCAKFCDQDVHGRPRFTLNKQFTDAKPTKQVLSDLAKTFRANVFFGGDQVLLVQDRPQDWINHYVNNSMTENGQFTVDSTEADQLFNEVIVDWDDPAAQFTSKSVVYRDEAAIARNVANGLPNNGVVSNRVYKIGCTNAQEAFNYAKLLCWISQNEAKTYTFNTAVGACNYAPGQLLEIDDWYRTGKPKVGRVKYVVDANTLELDAPFTFKANTSYKLHIVEDAGQVIKNLPMFSSETTTSTIHLTAHGLIDEQPLGIVQIGGGAQPVVTRIIDISERGPGQYAVTSQLHHSGKWAFIEDGTAVPMPPTTENTVGVPKPEGFTAVYSHRSDDVLGTLFTIETSWLPYKEPEGRVSSYTKVMAWDIQWKGPGDNDFRPWSRVFKTIHNVENAEPGSYVFHLRAINTLGAASETVELIFDLNTDGSLDLEPPVFEFFE